MKTDDVKVAVETTKEEPSQANTTEQDPLQLNECGRLQIGTAQNAAPVSDPPGRFSALALLMISMVCCLSPWFGATAALPSLKEKWGIDDTTAGVLTVMVQLGFLAGALASSFLAIADVVPPRRLFCMGGVGGAAFNILLLIPDLSFAGACVLRFLTGIAMAFVYPPGMKAAATWFKFGRGLGLGAMVGALCVGSALPNIIVGVQWETVIICVSSIAVFGAVLVLCGSDGPFPFKGVSHFQCALVKQCFQNNGTMLAIGAYTCHNWELYAMWSWFKLFTISGLEQKQGYTKDEANSIAGVVTFFVVASGSIGCILGGLCGDRIGRCKTSAAMLAISCVCSLVAGHARGQIVLLVAVGLLWGITSVGDSAQYTTMVAEVTQAEAVGTAVTLQLAIGYTVTAVTVFLVPVWESAIGWSWTFSFLSPPNVVAILCLYRLYNHSSDYRALIANGRG